MSDCGQNNCCGGTEYPDCQLPTIKTGAQGQIHALKGDGEYITIHPPHRFQYDPDQDYTHHWFTD